jgi:hypothetical protein
MPETQKIKYVRELTEFWEAYMSAVINEIYAGTGIALGLTEKEAYQQLNTDPEKLEKASLFKKVLDRFKRIFPTKIPKFRPKKGQFGTGQAMTPEQWDKFNKSLDDYWQKAANKITESVTTKGFLLGRETAEFREKKKPYKNKSLYQVNKDQYDGNMPDNIQQAYRKYDFTNAEKIAYNKELSSTAMYVTQTNNEVKDAIRQIINKGIEDEKTSIQVASDLYWNIEKDPNLTNKYTAETLRHNWDRIARTEMASLHESGKWAADEAEAMRSLKDPKKAKYYVRTGGNCSWCLSVRGTISRLVPASIVQNTKNNSLKSMGIKDPNTDSAIWVGQNNIGIKNQAEWMPCCPGHPNNVATNQPINLEDEFYNPKTDDVEKRQVKKKFVPELKDYSYKPKEEKEFRKPTFVDTDQVRYNNNVYERVNPSEYKRKKELWDKDPTQPIPVSTDSTRYDKIFGAAERNR